MRSGWKRSHRSDKRTESGIEYAGVLSVDEEQHLSRSWERFDLSIGRGDHHGGVYRGHAERNGACGQNYEPVQSWRAGSERRRLLT